MKKTKLIIKSIFKTFFLSLAIISQVHFAYAQSSASILPPAKTTFFDKNGNPLSSGKVFSYIPGTTTPKTTWQDAAETIPNANPVILDAAGRALILGSGNYRQIVQDSLSNQQWDQVTSSTGSGGGIGPISTGDGDLVGTVKPWAGMTAPNQYVFTYGQELSRTLFPVLFATITSTQAVFCNSGSPILNGLADTTNFWIGMPLEVSCVGAGFSTIISKTSTTVTIAANANVNLNTNAIFFPWGRGNGTTTFNLPNYRGLIPIGNNNMGGVASTNINDTYFGSQSANSIGGQGGVNGGGQVLLAANLPQHTHTSPILSDPGHNHTFPIFNTGSGLSGSANTGSLGNITTSTSTTGITLSANTGVNSTGTSTAFSIIPPTKTINYIIKVTPDANSATASGVTSLGGMTGDVSCGTGLTCAGNVISNSVIFNVPNTQDFTSGANFTPGVTTTLTLSSSPSSSANLTITFDGIGQNISTWSLGGAIITFSAAIPLNTQVVEAKWFTSTAVAGVSSLNSLGGVINVNAGNGTTVTTLGQNITVSNSINSASVNLGGNAPINDQTWVPPNPNQYHLFIPLAVKFNQNGLWTSCCGAVGAAFIPPSGSSLISLTAQIWVVSGFATTGGWTVKWIKNAIVDANLNEISGTEVCAGIGSPASFGTTLVIRGDCMDVPLPGDYYNLMMFIDSTVLGVTTVAVDSNPAHTYVQATVLK